MTLEFILFRNPPVQCNPLLHCRMCQQRVDHLSEFGLIAVHFQRARLAQGKEHLHPHSRGGSPDPRFFIWTMSRLLVGYSICILQSVPVIPDLWASVQEVISQCFSVTITYNILMKWHQLMSHCLVTLAFSYSYEWRCIWLCFLQQSEFWTLCQEIFASDVLFLIYIWNKEERLSMKSGPSFFSDRNVSN